MHSRNILVSLRCQALCAVGKMKDVPLALKHFSCEVCSTQVGSCLMGTLDGGVLESEQEENPTEAGDLLLNFAE